MQHAIYFLLMFSMAMHISVAADDEKEWQRRYDAISKQVCAQVKQECLVRFSAYHEDKRGMPVNNLHEVVLQGRVIVFAMHDPFWGKGKHFRSEKLRNPTWLDLARVANQMIHVTGDHHHIYLEDYAVVHEQDGIRYIKLLMGS